MAEPLRDLIASTLGFFERFGVQPTPEDMEHVFLEEVHELIEAVKLGEDRDHMAEEAADGKTGRGSRSYGGRSR
jgi:hypothetical protein